MTDIVLISIRICLDKTPGGHQKRRARTVKMYPASITKLMTCLIAMEEAQPDDVVTMTDEAVFAVPRDTTHIALTGGEQLTVEQLEYAMMVESANDAANGLAVHLAGSLEAFARRMNSRAAELLAGSGYTVDAGFHVSYAMIIMGILILFAAEVFAIGQNLSEEQKLTI